MKNQYVGDIGDYGKYGLLRFLAGKGVRIGVNWYLTEDDGSSDGKFTEYLKNPDESVYDKELFRKLRTIASRKSKTVRLIEDADLIPNAVYYSEILRSGSVEPRFRKDTRERWVRGSEILLKDTELIFADPDNGISYTKEAKDRDSEKFVLPDELVKYYNEGKNVVYYCHKGRRKQEDWERTKIRIKSHIPDAGILGVTFHRGTQRSYIFVVHPDHFQRYRQMLDDFLSTPWKEMFTPEEIIGEEEIEKRFSKKTADILLETIETAFSVCKVADYSGIDLMQPFVFTGSTDAEKSLVCPTALVPENTLEREDGWKGFRVRGVLDFSLIGILAGITDVLAEAEIGVFVVSTYNTDYVFTRETHFEKAMLALEAAGYMISEGNGCKQA